MADRLALFSLPAAEYAALRQRQQVALPPDTRPIDEIRFENLQTVNAEVARGELKTKVGEPLVFGVHVGKGPSLAPWRLASQEDVDRLLKLLIRMRSRRRS